MENHGKRERSNRRWGWAIWGNCRHDTRPKGHDVLLLDRQNFPRDKICGDGIPNGVISIMNSLGMAEKVKAAEARGDFNALAQVRLVSPKGHTVDAPLKHSEDGTKSYVAPRKYLDAIIQDASSRIWCGVYTGTGSRTHH